MIETSWRGVDGHIYDGCCDPSSGRGYDNKRRWLHLANRPSKPNKFDSQHTSQRSVTRTRLEVVLGMTGRLQTGTPRGPMTMRISSEQGELCRSRSRDGCSGRPDSLGFKCRYSGGIGMFPRTRLNLCELHVASRCIPWVQSCFPSSLIYLKSTWQGFQLDNAITEYR